MKIFTAALATETNTFAPFATSREDFTATDLRWMEASMSSAAQRLSIDLVIGPLYFAMPAGRTVRADYESMREELLASLGAALPVDAVVLSLHGAMVAQGYDDCEGDIAARVRAIVGEKIPVVLHLDPHAHLTRVMADVSTAIVFFKEWPHTDYSVSLVQAMRIAAMAAVGEVRPAMAIWDCRMISLYPTQSGPMAEIVAEMRALERENAGILAVSICHGFPYADVVEMGTKVVVVTDGARELAEKTAERIGRRMFSARRRIASRSCDLETGLAEAASATIFPVMIADCGDVTGGGAAGDNVLILKSLIERGVENVAVAYIWDPIALSICFKAGEGAHLDLRIGGFASPLSGPKLDVFDARVVRLFDDLVVDYERGGGPESQGRVALIKSKGAWIGLSERRLMALHSNHFARMGVDPAKQRYLIVKSANNYYAGFADLVARHIRISYPGPTHEAMGAEFFPHVRRPIWPIDEIEADAMGLFWSGAKRAI